MPLYHCLFPSCALLSYCLTFDLTSASHQQFKNDSFSILPFLPCFFPRSISISSSSSKPLLHCVPLPSRLESYSFLDPALATEAAPFLPQLSNDRIQFQTPPHMGPRSSHPVFFPECSLQPFPGPVAAAATRLFFFSGYNQLFPKLSSSLDPSTRFLTLTCKISGHRWAFRCHCNLAKWICWCHSKLFFLQKMSSAQNAP